MAELFLRTCVRIRINHDLEPNQMIAPTDFIDSLWEASPMCRLCVLPSDDEDVIQLSPELYDELIRHPRYGKFAGDAERN